MIELTAIEKTYHTEGVTTEVLRGVNITVGTGEYVAIMGASGSGKTTLMNILGLLDRPSSGRYLFEAQNVTGLDDKALSRLRNRRIGFVFQLFHLLDRLTVLDNVLLPLLYTAPYPGNAKARAKELLSSVGLSERMRFKPNALSGGQQQRVAIARALVNDPALLLADEPTGNLDSAMGGEILALFGDLHRQGRTIVLITHDPKVASCAGRVVTLADGKVVSDQRPTVRAT
jgi:putative ABC transport system ATP-binding protein